MPKEKQVGMPLVSYAPWQETLHRTPKNELDARSSQLGDPAPLSVTSSPILGEFAAAEAAPTSKNRYPDCCPDLAESEAAPPARKTDTQTAAPTWRSALRPAMDVRPLLAQRRAPPAPNQHLWRAFGAVALLQFVTLAAVLASRTAPDGRRQLLADELEPPFRKIREDLDLGADERRRLSGALWGLKTATAATTCVEIKILRRVRAESSRRPSRHRRDACSMA